MFYRLPTNIALALLITVLVGYIIMWGVAMDSGLAAAAFQANQGNHGPWHFDKVLSKIYNDALLGSMVATVVGLFGLLVEKSWRARIVAVLSFATIILGVVHFLLFD